MARMPAATGSSARLEPLENARCARSGTSPRAVEEGESDVGISQSGTTYISTRRSKALSDEHGDRNQGVKRGFEQWSRATFDVGRAGRAGEGDPHGGAAQRPR